MIKVLVTGANGYIGRHVVNELLNQGVHVIAVDVNVDGIDKRAEAIQADIFDGDVNIFDKLNKPDVCLHMAWRDGFIHNSDVHIQMLSKHYEFVKNMVNGGLKHIAVMGTMHEIGYFEGAIDENTPCNPISLYGIAKDTLRKTLAVLLKDKDVVFQWLRVFYIYGDDIKNHSIFTKLIQAEKEGKEYFPFNSGKNKYDFIEINELARQLTACILQKDEQGIINCCTGEPISLAEKVENFIKENGLKIKLQYGAFPDREYDSPAIWGNAEKINRIMSKRGEQR